MKLIIVIAIIAVLISQLTMLFVIKEIMIRLQVIERGYRMHLKIMHDHGNSEDVEVTIPLTMN